MLLHIVSVSGFIEAGRTVDFKSDKSKGKTQQTMVHLFSQQKVFYTSATKIPSVCLSFVAGLVNQEDRLFTLTHYLHSSLSLPASISAADWRFLSLT